MSEKDPEKVEADQQTRLEKEERGVDVEVPAEKKVGNEVEIEVVHVDTSMNLKERIQDHDHDHDLETLPKDDTSENINTQDITKVIDMMNTV